jgi:hypothetical protein
MKHVIRKHKMFWLMMSILVPLNIAAFAYPAPVSGDYHLEDPDGGCKKSGECINNIRTNCFCCSGLCWKCGDAC